MVEDVRNAEALAILDGLSAEEFALHGSPLENLILKPALPVQNPGLIEEYRKKAVYGSLMTEIALLYAVIHEPRDRWGWGVSHSQYRSSLFVEGPKIMRGGFGFIYICDRKSFSNRVEEGPVCFSTRQVKPKRVLRVRPNILEVLIDAGRLEFY